MSRNRCFRVCRWQDLYTKTVQKVPMTFPCSLEMKHNFSVWLITCIVHPEIGTGYDFSNKMRRCLTSSVTELHKVLNYLLYVGDAKNRRVGIEQGHVCQCNVGTNAESFSGHQNCWCKVARTHRSMEYPTSKTYTSIMARSTLENNILFQGDKFLNNNLLDAYRRSL